MQARETGRLEIMGSDNRPRIAWLTPIDVHLMNSPFTHTDDPLWVVRDPSNGQESTFEWITYFSGDGQIWRMKPHSHYQEDKLTVRTWLEHEMMDSSHNHDDEKIRFIGWDRKVWWAQTIPLPHLQLPKAPSFTVWPE
ncbi:MAG: hypothetical protein JSR42_14185 [Proteobacteria bacterium]|nr:hypothetical protein [Pseudomonadota bacterium]